MARMAARYPGTCRACGDRFAAGILIDYTKRAPKGQKTAHADCDDPGAEQIEWQEEFAGGVEPRTRTVSYVVRTSGGTFYRNRNGRCEDAPCCGCCTI